MNFLLKVYHQISNDTIHGECELINGGYARSCYYHSYGHRGCEEDCTSHEWCVGYTHVEKFDSCWLDTKIYKCPRYMTYKKGKNVTMTIDNLVFVPIPPYKTGEKCYGKKKAGNIHSLRILVLYIP